MHLNSIPMEDGLKGHSRPNMNLPQFVELCMLISAVLPVFLYVFQFMTYN